jgi:hypothetical protein
MGCFEENFGSNKNAIIHFMNDSQSGPRENDVFDDLALNLPKISLRHVVKNCIFATLNLGTINN